ncbi:MAG TPA: efflux RND transporter periplasmic adaptor subunit, partial [Methylophilaceae bacterium]|nr:efflux RND transporter periplasmic adaptor subunit [Methylophilaceae bacterium]
MESQDQYSAPAAADRSRRTARSVWPWLLAIIVIVAVVAFVLHRHSAGAKPDKAHGKFADGRPIPVVTAKVERRDVDLYIDALGTVTPRNTVVVKSRVDGELTHLYFKEGEMVQAGDLLAQIDPRAFQAQLAQAEGQLARDQALLNNALADLARYKTLLAQDSIARQQVDTQASLVNQYRGAIAVDQAQIDTAKLQVNYSRITAPISGRVGLRQVDPGNYVQTSDPNGIVVITQMKPIAVIFSLPEDDLPAILKQLSAGATLTATAYDR